MGSIGRILRRRDPSARARVERAAADVGRELAGNLELASLFGQTHQAVVFENGEFARHAAVLEAELRDAYVKLADVYTRIPEAEDAMARRGPAASIRPEDRALVERWEGDAREAQATLLHDAQAPAPSAWSAIVARLRGGSRTGR